MRSGKGVKEVDNFTNLTNKSLVFNKSKLVELHAIINKKDKAAAIQIDAGGLYPIHYATIFGDIKLFKQLHEAGARLDGSSAKGILPIHLAAFNDNADIVGYCLGRNPEQILSCDNMGYNLMHYACLSYHIEASGHARVLKFLFKNFPTEVAALLRARNNQDHHTALSLGSA
ncbi:MAG: ankyrin repeat domain-containing protein [Rickettsiales bacterium]|mgnify:FL=1|nr:ankyrin repeat domain-containing protein [Rickettsiales bacterium]